MPDTRYPNHSETLWYVDMALGKIGDADIVAIAARDGSVTVIDAESLAVVATPSVGYGVWGQSIALALSGIIVLAGSIWPHGDQGTRRGLDWDAKTLLRRLPVVALAAQRSRIVPPEA